MTFFSQVQEVLQSAFQYRTGDRTARLDELCHDQPTVRREVEELLEADRWAGDLLEDIVDPALEETFELKDPWVGHQLGPYKISRQLGEGGMGKVYLADRVDEEFILQVTIKLIRPGYDSAGIVNRFRVERNILADLHHPNIARLLDGGTAPDGSPYFVMEYIEKGRPIDQYCDEERQSIDERLELFRKVCSAVSYAHQRSVVHRDLKPSNILVDEKGTPYLLDFGIAKVLEPETKPFSVEQTVSGLRPMTLHYASPEQIQGQAITTATDTYALGVLLYELLCGQYPYRSWAAAPKDELRRAIREKEPEKVSVVAARERDAPVDESEVSTASARRRTTPEGLRRRLSGDLDNIVTMAMRKESERRYGSVDKLDDDVWRHLEGQPIAARPITLRYRVGKFVRRERALTAFIATLIAFAVGMSGLSYRLVLERDKVIQEREVAVQERKTSGRALDFLVKIFQTSDPFGPMAGEMSGGDTPVREVLDRGKEMAEEQLADEPAILAALLDAMGAAYMGMSSYATAEPMIKKGLMLRKGLLGNAHPDVAASLVNYGKILYYKGEYEAAEVQLKRALAVHQLSADGEGSDIAAVTALISEVLHSQGDYEAAEPLAREALAMRRSQLRDGHPDINDSLVSLADLLQAKGEYDEAESLHREALAMNRRVLGDMHHQVATNLNGLALVLTRKGKYEAAEDLYREALAIRRHLLGDEHVHVAVSINNLASVLKYQNIFDESEMLFREALSIRRRLLGEKHVAVAQSLNNLADLLRDQGDYGAAELLYRQALEMREELLGEHLDVAASLESLARLRKQQGDVSEAELLIRRSLNIRSSILGPKHHLVVQNLVNLAATLSVQGRYGAAEDLYRRALEMKRETLGDDHPYVAGLLSNLGRLLYRQGRLDEAKDLTIRALELNRKIYGNNHTTVAIGLCYLADLRQAKGRFQEAQELYSEALVAFREIHPEGHPDLAIPMVGLGRAMVARGTPEEAEPLLREAVEIRRRKYVEGDWRTAEAESVWGGCLLALKRYEEAAVLLKGSHAALVASLGERNRLTVQSHKRLSELMSAIGRGTGV